MKEETEQEDTTSLEVAPERISLQEVYDAFLEEDDPQTIEMVLFRVAEHVVHRNPTRSLGQLLRQLAKATDVSSQALTASHPEQKVRFETALHERLLRSWYLASGEDPRYAE